MPLFQDLSPTQCVGTQIRRPGTRETSRIKCWGSGVHFAIVCRELPPVALLCMNLGLVSGLCRGYFLMSLLPMFAFAEEPSVKTYSFKTFDSSTNQLQADVHRLPDDTVRPVIVFIHGGKQEDVIQCGFVA
jgi:hypothetical protein